MFLALFLLVFLPHGHVLAADDGSLPLAPAFEDPLQQFFCGKRENPGFLAFELSQAIDKKGKAPACSAPKSEQDAFYCHEIAPTNHALRKHHLSEADFLKFEVIQDLRKQVRASPSLRVAHQAYDDYRKKVQRMSNDPASACSQAQSAQKIQEAREELGERLYCLAGNRKFADEMLKNLVDHEDTGSTLSALSQAIGSKRSLFETASLFSRSTIGDQNEVYDEDFFYLSPTLQHYTRTNLKTPASRDKMCYYASAFNESLHLNRERLHHIDEGLLWAGVGTATAGSIMLGTGVGAPAGGALLGVAEATAWGASALFTYRALRHFFNAIYPQESLGQLSLFLDTNPYDNRCKNTLLIPEFMDETLSKISDHDEALLWQSLTEVAAAFCVKKCVEAGVHLARSGSKVIKSAARPVLTAIEAKGFLKANFHNIDWSKATPTIITRIRAFVETHPAFVMTMEQAADMEIGRILMTSGTIRAAARGSSRGTQELLIGKAAAGISDDGDVQHLGEADPDDDETKGGGAACRPVVTPEKAALYVKYLARPKAKKNPADCLLIGR